MMLTQKNTSGEEIAPWIFRVLLKKLLQHRYRLIEKRGSLQSTCHRLQDARRQPRVVRSLRHEAFAVAVEIALLHLQERSSTSQLLIGQAAMALTKSHVLLGFVVIAGQACGPRSEEPHVEPAVPPGDARGQVEAARSASWSSNAR